MSEYSRYNQIDDNTSWPSFTTSEEGERIWNVQEGDLQPQGSKKPSAIQEEYGNRLLADYDLEKPTSKTEVSRLRNTSGRIFIGDNEYRVDGVNKFIRTKNPNDLKFNPQVNQQDANISDSRFWSANKVEKANQQRFYSGTGFLPDGTFAAPEVIRQAKKLDRTSMWPQGKSFQGFKESIIADWNFAQARAKGMKHQFGITGHAGHVAPAKGDSGVFTQGGSMSRENVVDQPGLPADETKRIRTVGGVDYAANVPLGNKMFKGPDDLRWAGFGGFNISEAFNEYLIRDDTVKDPLALNEEQRSRSAHEVGVGAEESKLRSEKQNALDIQRMEEGINSFEPPADNSKNPVIPDKVEIDGLDKIKTPKSRAKGLMNVVKNTFKSKKATTGVFRGLARAAGMSNNPLVNIAGDVVGAAIDGAVFVADPSVDNAADLILSGGQVLTTGAGMLVAALPVPGARPGAFAIMKLGDVAGAAGNAKKVKERIEQAGRTLATIERLWNMSGYREAKALDENRKSGIMNVEPSDARAKATPATPEDALRLQKRFKKTF